MKSAFTFMLIVLLSTQSIAQTWTLNYNTETVTEHIVALSAPDDNVCWFVTNFDNLYKTADGGVNWEKLLPSGTSFNPSGLYVIDENVAFKSSNQLLFRTADGGQSWLPVFTGSQFSPPVVRMKDAFTSVSASGGTLHKTINGGISWSAAAVTQPPENIQNSSGKCNVFNLDDELWVTQQGGGIAYSADFGDSWETPSNIGFTSIGVNARISFSSSSFGIATKGSVWPYVYVTNDGGNSWVNTDDSQGANEDVIASGTELWYIPNPADHFYIKHSADGGGSWQIQLQLEGGHGFNVLEKARAGRRLWAGTGKGALYTYVSPLSAAVIGQTELKIYPNPASEIIYFNTNEVKSVKIRNISGSVVAARNISKTGNGFLEVSALSNGIYTGTFTSDQNIPRHFKLVIQH